MATAHGVLTFYYRSNLKDKEYSFAMTSTDELKRKLIDNADK